MEKFSLEEELILLLCNEHQKVEEKKIEKYSDYVDWNIFVGIVINNRVNGTIYKSIEKMECIPTVVKRSLQYLYFSQKERSHCHKKEIVDLSNKLEENKINYVFLKGSVLNYIYYDYGERISNDTDIIVSPKELNKVINICKGLGYIQGHIDHGRIVRATRKEILFAHLNTYETVPLVKEIGNRYMPFHEIDINFRLGNDDQSGMSEKMLENNQILKKNDFCVRTLEKEKFLLFLCIHLYREAVMVFKIVQGEDLLLYKFLDIHRFIVCEGELLDWDELSKLSLKLDRRRDVYYTLFYTEILFPGTIKEEILSQWGSGHEKFLNQYRGRDNSEEVYNWKLLFHERMFKPLARMKEAKENIEREGKRLEKIEEELRNVGMI